MLPIEPELADRVVNIRESEVHRVLFEARANLRHPELHEDLQRRHVEIAVMEIGSEVRHVPDEETAVLANAVAANRRSSLIDVLPQELERAPFRLCFVDGARAH